MRPGFPVWLLLLSACGPGAAAPPPGQAAVVVTNAKGEPIANASTWWLPAGAMANRDWLLACDSSIRDHSFEVLRRHGHARTSDSNGLVAAPPGAWIAALSGELAGVAQVPDPLSASAEPVRLAIDDCHWVVRTVDHHGAPLADVTIGARPSLGATEERASFDAMLGQTDAAGILVVRAPGGIAFVREEIRRVQERAVRRVEVPSAVVVALCVGEGDEATIALTPGRSLDVTMTLDDVRRTEITTPADLWPRLLDVWSRHAIGGASEVAGSCVLHGSPGLGKDLRLHAPQWSWSNCSAGEPDATGVCHLDLPMPPQVAVVRARLLAHDGAAAERCHFQLERAKEQRQSRAWSQPDGTILVWLDTSVPMPSTMRVEAISSVAPERIGQHTTLVLPKLTAGQRVDLGTLTLSRP